MSTLAVVTGRLRSRWLCFAVTLVCAFAGGRAQPARAQPPESIAFTVSGGASLGSYEAGYLYYVTRVMQANPQRFRLQIATGASAGSTNAVVATLASCLPPEQDPLASPFFRVWAQMTFNALMQLDDTTALGALSTHPLEQVARDIGELWEAGLPETCDVVLGISATRVRPYSMNLDDEAVELPRTDEKFSLRIRGRGMGRAPELSNYVNTTQGAPTARLPVDGDQPNEYQYLSDLVLASSAFPVVFAPRRLSYCVHDPREVDVPPCTPDTARQELFIDGGILDNQPLNLAARTAIRGFIPNSDGAAGYRFRDEPDVTQYALPDNTYFLFLDPSAVAYPEPREEEDTSGAWSALDLILEVVSGFVESARANELRTIVETNPAIRERILVTRSYFPQISAPLGGFFGLFDRELTHFDFILGMYDARRLWQSQLGPAYLARHGLPADTLTWPDPSEPTGAWLELTCMRGVFDDDEDLIRRCEGLDRTTFLPALQTTLERLYVSCHLAERGVPRGTTHMHCERAQHADAVPPRLAALPPDSAWQQRPDEEETDYAVRRLAANGFVFRDLGLDAAHSARASLRIRQELGRLARAFRRAQPHHRAITSAVAEVALNEFLYRPPRHILSFDVSPDIGIGYSFTNPYGHAPFLRVTVGLGIQGATTLLSSARNEFGIAPSAGLEFEPVRLNGSLLRGRLGVRAGYALSSVDNYGAGTCDAREQANLRCSRFFIDAYALLTLVDVVRISLGITYAPPLGHFDRGQFGFRPTIGLQWRSGR